MKPLVLLVGRDPGCWRSVPKGVEVMTRATAREALAEIGGRRTIWVAMTDLSLPDLSGIEFLAAVRTKSPDTVRLLVVPAAETAALVAAINLARVFSVLVEPVTPESFRAALDEGVEVFRRAVVARQIGLHEHAGIVHLVTGWLSPAHKAQDLPPAAIHLRDRVRIAARLSRLPNDADLETAAMLSLVGLAAVPPHVLEKLLTHARLTEDEAAFLDEIPAVGLRLIDGLPQFDGVAAILRQQGGDPEAVRVLEDGRREHVVPLASRILRVIVDLQVHENAGMVPSAAMAAMRHASRRYDRSVLRALENLFAENSPAADPRFVPRLVDDLIVNSVLVADAVSFAGVSLVAARTVLTPGVLAHLRNYAELGDLVEPLYVERRSESQAAADRREPR